MSEGRARKPKGPKQDSLQSDIGYPMSEGRRARKGPFGPKLDSLQSDIGYPMSEGGEQV